MVLINKEFGDKLQKFGKQIGIINDAIKTRKKEKELLVPKQKNSKKDYMDVVSEPKTTKFKREEKFFEVKTEKKGFKGYLSVSIVKHK